MSKAFRISCTASTKSIAVFILTILVFSATARVLPENGSQLNHTQVMFEYDQFIGASRYKVVISNRKHPADEIVAYSSSLAILFKQGLEFGNTYSWHYEAYNGTKQLFRSKDFEFSIASSYLTDKSFYRYYITQDKPAQRKDGLLFIETLGVAINRQGEPVWFLPYDSVAGKPEPKYRNLCMTNEGTITYLTEDDCIEKTIDNDLVWKAPNNGVVSGDKSEHYHHDFQKLPDGTYVASGYIYRDEPNPANTSVTCHIRYNTLIQYNAAGQVLWTWTDMGHFSPQTIFDGTLPTDIETAGTHLNSFYYDEQTKAFVVSFRNISRIIKIDKGTGNIIYQFGKRLEKDTTALNETDAYFSQQHGALLLPNGNLIFYNNNPDDTAKIAYPHIVELTQPLNGKLGKVVWDYECITPQFPHGLRSKEGYALPLANSNILVSVGGENRVFELNKAKEILWECRFEKLDNNICEWKPFTNYRSHFTSSLYPYYFTITRNGPLAAVNTALPFNKLSIHNDGSEDDTYSIEIESSNGSIGTQKIVLPIQAGKSSVPHIKLQRKKPLQAGEELTVTVSPASSPNQQKTLSFRLAQ